MNIFNSTDNVVDSDRTEGIGMKRFFFQAFFKVVLLG